MRDVVARRDHPALVQPAVELDDDLAGAVVVDELELADVALLQHHRQELDDDLGRGAEEDLALAALLGVGERLEGVAEDADPDHGVCVCVCVCVKLCFFSLFLFWKRGGRRRGGGGGERKEKKRELSTATRAAADFAKEKELRSPPRGKLCPFASLLRIAGDRKRSDRGLKGSRGSLEHHE